ncbi:hypothetical protein QQZ08_000437 [Neonectria magnoliae]|uniref:Uncharacterized protein n=1 Tax=Neonectria magnoliae TaxID=2732573 RepID=A0ABR1IIJ4_9HYPO
MIASSRLEPGADVRRRGLVPQEYVDEHLGGHWLLSELDVREGFVVHKRRTAHSKAYLDGSDTQLRDAWVKVLRKLGGRLRKVRIGKRRCGRMRPPGYHYDSSSWRELEPPCVLTPHRHHGDDENRCVRAAAVAGDEETVKSACDAVHALLDKNHASLQCLKIHVKSPMFWPSRRRPPYMPVLKRLHIKEVNVHAPLLARWIAHMPQLQHFEIFYSKLFKGLYSHRWIDVLDAIRDHPNVAGPNLRGLKVDVGSLMPTNSIEIAYHAMVRCGDNVATRGLHEDGTYEGEDSDRNYVLRYWLNCYDPDDTDSELDEDTDENWEAHEDED